MNTRASRLWDSLLLAAFLALALAPARAELVSTDRLAADAKIQADREKVQAFLQRADAERSLQALGVKPELAQQRVAALTNEEVAMIAGKIDSLPAGGALSTSDIIIILLVAILVVLVI
jgi:hypothetical protein